jgi:hypothetical protein
MGLMHIHPLSRKQFLWGDFTFLGAPLGNEKNSQWKGLKGTKPFRSLTQ